MLLMRDKRTGAEVEVTEKWLARWPDDYAPLKTTEPSSAPKAPAKRRAKKSQGDK